MSEQDEMLELQTRPQHVPAMCDEQPKLEPQCGCQVCRGKRGGGAVVRYEGMSLCDFCMRRLISAHEVNRAPLPHYGQRTPFTTFDGYTVSSDCCVEAQPSGTFGGLRLDGCTEFRAPRAL